MASAGGDLLQLRVRNFSGGLNTRDAPIELSLTEAQDAWNVTADERGGITKRLGYAKYNADPYQAALVSNVFYWAGAEKLVVQCGAKLYEDDSVSEFATLSTDARCGFADFQDTLCVIHPIDGLFTWDGANWTAIADGPKGTCLYPFQNRLAAGGDPANQSRLYLSAIGDVTKWLTADNGVYNDFREKDGEAIVALSGSPNLDNQGRPGLLVFKRESFYRCYDSDTGAYVTLDFANGAASSLSVVNVTGLCVFLSLHGIFKTNGVSEAVPAAPQIETLWTALQVAYDQPDLYCAGRSGERVRFSLPRYGSSANDLALEYHPQQSWVLPGSNAVSCYATYAKETEVLLGGSPSVDGQVYVLDSGGDDDGSDIASWFQTRWYEPDGGILSRMRRVRVYGRGVVNFAVKTNYGTGAGNSHAVALQSSAFLWNDPNYLWNTPAFVWGPTALVNIRDIYSLGTAKSVSFRISETSSLLAAKPKLLGGTGTTEAGAWAIYGLDLVHIPLGLA